MQQFKRQLKCNHYNNKVCPSNIKFILYLSIIAFLTACGTTPKQNQHKYFPDQPSINNSYHSHRSYICQTPQHFAGNVVGDGHCVDPAQLLLERS